MWLPYSVVGWTRSYFICNFVSAFCVPFYWILIWFADNCYFLVLFHIHILMHWKIYSLDESLLSHSLIDVGNCLITCRGWLEDMLMYNNNSLAFFTVCFNDLIISSKSFLKHCISMICAGFHLDLKPKASLAGSLLLVSFKKKNAFHFSRLMTLSILLISFNW